MEFRKNGFNDSDAATLAKTATMFQNVSDEAISAGDSASFIISQMIAFGIEAKDAQSIIDKVNQTSNEFSVSSGDLAQALGIVASTSSAMGNSLDETLGLVVAMTEQTRSASKSARGLNTIASRLSQVLDESSDTGAKLIQIYDDLGISLKDSSGQLRSTYDILSDLHGKWDTLDTDTQKYIALTSAGTNQLNNFLALMNNFDHATDATATSLNSAGSAMKENEAYQESLEYQTNNLKAEFQDLANNVIDKQLITMVLNLSEAFLKLANTGVGQLVSKVALLGGSMWGLQSLIKVSNIMPTIISQFSNLATVLATISNPAVRTAIGGIGTAISSVGGFSAIALPTLLAVSAAIVGIVELVDYLQNKDTRKLEGLASNLQETQDAITSMTAEGSEYQTLLSNADKLTQSEQERLGILQAQLDTLKEQSAEQEADYLKEWQEQRTKTQQDWIWGTGTTEEGTSYTGYVWGDYTQSSQDAENLRRAINSLNAEKRLGTVTNQEYITSLQGIIDEYQETYDTTIKVRDAGYELDDSQKYLVKVIEHQEDVIGRLGAEYAQNSEDIGQFNDAVDESASKLDIYIAALDQYRGANEDAASASSILVNSLFDANGQLTEAAKQALTTDGAMASMAQSFIEAQQAQAQTDFSALILAIEQVGSAAAMTSAQIASMMSLAGTPISGVDTEEGMARFKGYVKAQGYSDVQSYIKDVGQKNYQRKIEEYQKQLESISSYVPKSVGGGGDSSSRKDQEEVKEQTIKTIDELREYLTNEETRLKLIDPDISKTDLESTLTEVATIYQSYQNYLSSLKQQGFDETSEQYQQAEAEFAQFVETLKTLFAEIVANGKYDVDELVEYITKNCGDMAESISGLLGGLQQKVTSTVSAVSQSIHQAFASGDPNSAINAIETAWKRIREMSDGSDILQAGISSALSNASAEQEAANELSEEYEWQNQLLEDKIKLEEKLEALEKAKQRRMLVYSEGRFQYMQDADAISSARADYQETYRNVEQSQTSELISKLGEENEAYFRQYFSKDVTGDRIGRYERSLQNHLMKLLKEQTAGSVYEGMTDEELYNVFGDAMKPGKAYQQIVDAYTAAQEAAAERRERKEELKKQIREENVKYYGVDTDYGEKIKNAQSQAEVEYWTTLRDTKLEMIKDYREAYGDEAASKYFGTDVSKMDTWKSNQDLYKEGYESGSKAWEVDKSLFERQFYEDPEDKYTVKNPDLTAAQYNAATAIDMEGLGNQRIYNKIFDESITKAEIQELYDKAQSDRSKGYLLNLASEMYKAGYPGYAYGTRRASGGLSVVGENGPELRVLNSGDGIIPSNLTENLWRWGSMTPMDMLQSLAQKTQSMMQTLNISNVTLPNVRDAQSFVSGLREYAQQYVTRRN